MSEERLAVIKRMWGEVRRAWAIIAHLRDWFPHYMEEIEERIP